jgi:hypothetical protein
MLKEGYMNKIGRKFFGIMLSTVLFSSVAKGGDGDEMSLPLPPYWERWVNVDGARSLCNDVEYGRIPAGISDIQTQLNNIVSESGVATKVVAFWTFQRFLADIDPWLCAYCGSQLQDTLGGGDTFNLVDFVGFIMEYYNGTKDEEVLIPLSHFLGCMHYSEDVKKAVSPILTSVCRIMMACGLQLYIPDGLLSVVAPVEVRE